MFEGKAGDFWPQSSEAWEPIPDDVLDELGPLPLEPGVPGGADHADRIVEYAVSMPAEGAALTLLAGVPTALVSKAAAAHALAAMTAISSHAAAVSAGYTSRLAEGEPWRLVRGDTATNPAAHEVSAATKTSVYAADAAISLALSLSGVLRATGSALREGRITLAQAKSLHNATAAVSADITRAVEARVLPRAAVQSLVNFSLCVRRACAALDPSWTNRSKHARREVVVEHTVANDGSGSLYIRGPLEDTTAISLALNAYAARTKVELGGTADQRKLVGLRDWAEAYASQPDAPRAHRRPPVVHVTIDLLSLLGLRDHPADIPGVGPIPADAVRWMVMDGSPMRRMIIDSDNGHCLDYGRTTYTAPADLAEYLAAVNITSAGPFSNVPATISDLDHNPAYDDGGRTDRATVTPLDRRWHIARHHGWAYSKDPVTAVVTWTSPSGMTADVLPYDYRCGP